VDVSLERGSKRVFASAVAWPGYARAGRDEATALEALVAYGDRYAAALKRTRLGFRAPADVGVLHVVALVAGNATTDLGAPDTPAPGDDAPVDDAELRRSVSILRAVWRTFDASVEAARGATLATGPRGGGRPLDAIVEHVAGAEGGYLARIGAKGPAEGDEDRLDRTREVVLDALARVARDGVPPSPRGGKRWTPRFFVRRSAWHVLDHAWELEDRTP
jgi:hypothetical protein